MKVEIWSDIMCPFCYIGKRKFELALAQFPERADIQVVWRSFQLDPDIVNAPDKNVYQYLAERKGQSVEWAKQVSSQVTEMAAAVGLDYHFEKSVVANSWDAHRLIQMAKAIGKNTQHANLGDAAEEALFKAYFTDGKNMADAEVLAQLGASIGLDPAEIKEMLQKGQFDEAIEGDLALAQQFGVRGVPFFAFDRKYAISGAQEPDAFLQVLQKSFAEWRIANPAFSMSVMEGPSCTPDGECN
jgi:predicted DsbA family dithiol-disulfide isomerase